MSPGLRSAWWTILFDVDVPLVTKKLRSPPRARAALSCATLMLPVGSSRLSRPPGGRRRFGEEQVGPVELAHVADPVGLEDRLPAGHRQRVEGADRALGVALEIVEVRRLVAVLHAVEDRQVDLHRLLDPVEDPPDRRRLGGAGQPGDVAVGREIDVELRPPPAHQLRQEDPEIAAPRGLGDLHLAGQDLAQHRHRVLRGVPEAVADHDRLEIRVEDHGEHRVLEAPDHDRLVDELVLDAPQPAEGLPDLRPHGPLGGRDEQDLEVRPPALTAADRRRQDIGQMGLALLVRLPGFLVIPVAVAEERAADPLHQTREARPVPGLQALVHLRHQPGPGVAAELLQRRQLGEQRLRVLAGAARRPPPGPREGLGDAVQRPPAVHPRLRGREELVQTEDPVVRRCRAHFRFLPRLMIPHCLSFRLPMRTSISVTRTSPAWMRTCRCEGIRSGPCPS